MSLNVGFTCRIAPVNGSLEVTYSIENRTGEELGAFNRIKAVRIDATSDFSPNNAYVDYEDGKLLIRKMALPLPPGLQAGGYAPPNASRIPAGETFTETFALPIPVRVCNPFKRATIRGEVVADVPVSAREVEVVIGVFPCGAGCQLTSEHPAFPDVFTAVPPGEALRRQVSLTWPFSCDPPIPVLDYRGVPW